MVLDECIKARHQSKTSEAQRNRFGGKVVWRFISDILRGRRGLVPVTIAIVRDKEENDCNTLEQQQQRWRRHFAKLLNIQNEFNEDKLQKAKQRLLRPNMSPLLSEEEMWGVIGKLKSGMAGGDSGILLEMVKATSCEERFFHFLMDLVHSARCECRVPKE